MRSVSSAIISFVIFYMGLCWSKKERKDYITRGIILVILDDVSGSIYIDDFWTLMDQKFLMEVL